MAAEAKDGGPAPPPLAPSLSGSQRISVVGAHAPKLRGSDTLSRRASFSIEHSFELIAAESCEELALQLVTCAAAENIALRYHPTEWKTFSDGTDNILIGGFSPINYIRNSHVIFLANFKDNATMLSQYHAMVTLCESFVESLTIILPYYPHGTMERVVQEGRVVRTCDTRLAWGLVFICVALRCVALRCVARVGRVRTRPFTQHSAAENPHRRLITGSPTAAP